MRLVATTEGDGWQTTQRAACRRCGDDQQWSCLRMQASTQATLPDGSTAVVHGLSGDLATRAIRFLLASPAAELRDVSRSALASITCLTSNSDPRRIYVEYGGVPHHAGIDYGVIVLEPQGKSFRIESVEPPPNWFEDSGARFPECGGGEIDVYPSC